MSLTASQLRALQSLWSVYERHSLDAGGADPRAARLAWAAEQLVRPIQSFSELTGHEAAQLIDKLKGLVGQRTGPRRPGARRDRQSAVARGTHGRKGRVVNIEMLATAADLAEVHQLRDRAGMTPEQFDSWLMSRSSPIRGRAKPELRTISDCNKVRWALLSMLRRAG